MFPFLKKKPKIIVVLGQTSTGKSDLAVEIAKKIGGEIISADSRQVYRGMDLGSGKITKEEMQGVPHHLLDVADPKDIFSVADFQKLGTQAIQDILSRGKIPIVCGGTGFYIDALVYQTSLPEVPPNEKLRAELATKSLQELQKLLEEKLQNTEKKWWENIPFLSPLFREKRKIDMQNPVRIIRAIEIVDAFGYIPQMKRREVYNVLFIGLTLPKKQLDARIHKRILTRLEKGMVEEVKRLLKDDVSHERLESFGLEYRYIGRYLRGELTYEEMIEKLKKATIRFARRQKTWFKRNNKIHWFNPIKDRKKLFELVNRFKK